MAQNNSLISVLAGAQVVRDPNIGATVDANVGPGASTLYLVQVDNTNNPTQDVFLKLYNNTAPTVGTTAPDKIFPVPGGSIQKVVFQEGVVFSAGISMACTQSAGTAGTSAPTNPVIVALTITTP